MKLFVGSRPRPAQTSTTPLPDSEGSRRTSPRGVVAQPAVDEHLAEPPFQRRDQFLEPATSNRPGLKGVPRREQVPDDAKPAATHEGTRAAALDNFSEIALQMRPAQLPAVLGHL